MLVASYMCMHVCAQVCMCMHDSYMCTYIHTHTYIHKCTCAQHAYIHTCHSYILCHIHDIASHLRSVRIMYVAIYSYIAI